MSEEITEMIIKKLYGEIEPVGETDEDEERYNNLLEYMKLYYIIYDNLLKVAKYKNDERYSVKKIGEKAYKILKYEIENIEADLENLFEE